MTTDNRWRTFWLLMLLVAVAGFVWLLFSDRAEAYDVHLTCSPTATGYTREASNTDECPPTLVVAPSQNAATMYSSMGVKLGMYERYLACMRFDCSAVVEPVAACTLYVNVSAKTNPDSPGYIFDQYLYLATNCFTATLAAGDTLCSGGDTPDSTIAYGDIPASGWMAIPLRADLITGNLDIMIWPKWWWFRVAQMQVCALTGLDRITFRGATHANAPFINVTYEAAAPEEAITFCNFPNSRIQKGVNQTAPKWRKLGLTRFGIYRIQGGN